MTNDTKKSSLCCCKEDALYYYSMLGDYHYADLALTKTQISDMSLALMTYLMHYHCDGLLKLLADD